jgi:hypothetical protein
VDAPEHRQTCRTCKSQPPGLGLHGRCESCHNDFQTWLAGGVHYQPRVNGVLSAPRDDDEDAADLHSALVWQEKRRRGVV